MTPCKHEFAIGCGNECTKCHHYIVFERSTSKLLDFAITPSMLKAMIKMNNYSDLYKEVKYEFE